MTIGGHAAGEGSSASRDGGPRESWMPAAIRLPRRVRPGTGERDLGAVKQLMAADGLANTAIAQRLDVDVVSRWRKRFAEGGLAGWPTASAPGQPRTFTAPVVAQVKALACELPAASGTPLAKWSCPELARETAARGITASVSARTVRRWLAQDVRKPWRHRSWIFPATRISRSRQLRASACGLDVLVDVEHIVRVVAVLDLGEPVIVTSVGRFDPVAALVHHEVDVGAARGGRVQLLPVVPGPLRDEAGVGGVGVDAHDDARPAAVPVGEGGRAL